MDETGMPVTTSSAGGSPDREFIRLDQFLKAQRCVPSGGAAKWAIRARRVRVNGHVEERRGRKLYHGDRVEFDSRVIPVTFGAD